VQRSSLPHVDPTRLYNNGLYTRFVIYFKRHNFRDYILLKTVIHELKKKKVSELKSHNCRIGAHNINPFATYRKRLKLNFARAMLVSGAVS